MKSAPANPEAPFKIWIALAAAFGIPSPPVLAQFTEPEPAWQAILLTWGPVLLIIALWIFFLRLFVKRSGGRWNPAWRNEETFEKIEGHLADISKKMEELAEEMRRIGRGR